MFDNFKKGFGLTAGGYLGYLVIKTGSKMLLTYMANDENFINQLKYEKPKVYETLKKYKYEEDTE